MNESTKYWNSTKRAKGVLVPKLTLIRNDDGSFTGQVTDVETYGHHNLNNKQREAIKNSCQNSSKKATSKIDKLYNLTYPDRHAKNDHADSDLQRDASKYPVHRNNDIAVLLKSPISGCLWPLS